MRRKKKNYKIPIYKSAKRWYNQNMNENTVCFTGHRKLNENENLINERLFSVIENLVSEGFTRFIAGGALGFDTLAAYAVLEIRETHPHISLAIAIPHRNQAGSWSDEEKDEYKKILEAADEQILLSENYFRGCFHVRNRYMVDNSTVCVAYLLEEKGGTFSTVKYAQKKGLRVINLAE